jgi:hypothetical protein
VLATYILIQPVEERDRPVRQSKPFWALEACRMLDDLLLQKTHHQSGSIQELVATERSWTEITRRALAEISAELSQQFLPIVFCLDVV